MPALSCGRTLRAASILFAFAFLAACASAPKPRGETSPHYKVGEPYRIDGRWYYPREDSRYDEVGIASWYGDEFHGRPTANGEVFDKRRLSAAHTTLPLPTLVEVENLENGRRIVLRVNDRGPFAGDRIIDVSHAAAKALGFERAGLTRVRVRYVGRAVLAERAPLYDEDAPAPRIARAKEPRIAQASPRRQPTDRKPVPRPEQAPAGMAIDADLPPGAVAGTGADAGYWIAVATFYDLGSLETARAAVSGLETARVVSATNASGAAVYGLEIGPFASLAAAADRLAELRDAGYPDAALAGEIY
jgi:rare lipoprotein A